MLKFPNRRSRQGSRHSTQYTHTQSKPPARQSKHFDKILRQPNRGSRYTSKWYTQQNRQNTQTKSLGWQIGTFNISTECRKLFSKILRNILGSSRSITEIFENYFENFQKKFLKIFRIIVKNFENNYFIK